MAHRILGLDIGNRAIRAAIVDKTLRQTLLAGWDTEPLASDADEPARVEAIRRLLQRNLRPDDVVAVGVPTAVCMHRTLAFPFRDDKAITEAVGFELENHIPTPLSELVVDHVQLGQKDGQTEVLAVAAPRREVERWLERLRTAGTDARRLGASGLVYASLIRALPDLKAGTTMLVDIGVRTSEVVVTVDGETQYLRSLSTGAEGVAQSLAAGQPTDDETIAQRAWLLPAGAVPESQDERQRHDATVTALGPLLRELRQTVSAWQRKARTRPDRVVLTGGLARLPGLHEFVERGLGLPVVPVRLQDLPDVRLPDADQLGDTGALAVAQAFAAAEARPDQDVDFRQDDLAYEGDFKILRARLPQMAAFVLVALCLLGIRTSLTWRTLLSEHEQQLTQLEGVAKSVTGKASRDFEALRKELKREPSVDLAGLYPDLSAFKTMEEISAIVDKVTEPPDYVAPPAGAPAPPPGPAEEPPPSRPSFEAPPGMRERQRGVADGVPPDPETGQPAEPGARPGPPTGPVPHKPVDKDKDKDKDDAAAPAKDENAGHQLELASMQIERNAATIRGDADTQEALLALQQAIDAHRCFAKAKSSSDKITFERHNGWYKFTIQFEIACPHEEEAKAKKQAEAEAEGDKKKKPKGEDEDEE